MIKHCRALFPAFLFIALFAGITPALARIDIVPQKIVIGPRERSAEITIMNMFNEPGTFRLDLINFNQDENGTYRQTNLQKDPNFDPNTVVRYSPRQFTLPAGGRQKVRLSLRKPGDLPDGEYRFHVKTMRFGEPSDSAAQEDDGQSIRVVMNMGVTIPIIVRHGTVTGDANMQDIRLVPAAQTQEDRPQLQMRVNRTGNKSAMCVVNIYWQPAGGEEQQIGTLRNVNLFTDIDYRNVKVNLDEYPSGNGTLRVELLNEETLELFDEAVLR